MTNTTVLVRIWKFFRGLFKRNPSLEKIIVRDGIIIKLHLNANQSVNLKKKMQVKYRNHLDELIIKEIFPDKKPTIDAQFEFVKAERQFEIDFERALQRLRKKSENDEGKNPTLQ